MTNVNSPTASSPANPSKVMFIVGWVLGILPCGLLLFSAVGKLLMTPPPPGAENPMANIGWEPSQMKALGIVELCSTLIYLFPRTAVVGAILLTGYMGGAIATHARVHEDIILQTAFPIVLWLGLFLREPRLRALIPWRK